MNVKNSDVNEIKKSLSLTEGYPEKLLSNFLAMDEN
jgi:hypothetical protein